MLILFGDTFVLLIHKDQPEMTLARRSRTQLIQVTILLQSEL